MNASAFSELWSHPQRLLLNHLEEVGQISQELVTSKLIEGSPEREECLLRTVYLIGFCHDFGKGTHFFQRYIRNQMKKSPQTTHGLLSAIFTFYVLKNETSLRDFPEFPFFGYLAVKRHHGNLRNFRDELASLRDEKLKDQLMTQIPALDEQILTIYESIITKAEIENFKKTYLTLLEVIRKEGRKFAKNLKKSNNLSYYINFQLLYSCLLSADKISASEIHERSTIEIPASLIDNFFHYRNWLKPSNHLNSIRMTIYNMVIDRVESLVLDNQRVYSLNVPTGTGKTFTSLSFALKLRAKIHAQYGTTPKIIYCLPFLSIIDQNFAVIHSAIKEILHETPPTTWLVKHHHLAEALFVTEESEYTGAEGTFLIESWISEIIVTTFVQFFHTLFSNKNRSLRKFNSIINAIIILDEVQSLPHKYWLLFRSLVHILSEQFGVFFLFMSATQPLIMNPSNDEILELVEHKETIFNALDRVVLHFHPTTIHLDELKIIIKDMVQQQPAKSVLIVMNTINAAKEIASFLKSHLDPSFSFYYLSTHVIPKDRLKRIEEIKLDTKRKIIVSTQLIEAGVDIDVDIVVRDFAPLDCINQVAGRCNRNNKRQKGEVHVFTVKDDSKEYHKYIYSSFLIRKTQEVLATITGPISEKDFLRLNNLYYQKIQQDHSTDIANEILTHVINLRFQYLNEQFRLIDNQDYQKTDVFIEIDQPAKDLWQQFLNLQTIPNGWERKNAFRSFKNHFYDYVISVPSSKAPPIEDESFTAKTNLGLAYISLAELNHWYDKGTGFNPKEGGTLLL